MKKLLFLLSFILLFGCNNSSTQKVNKVKKSKKKLAEIKLPYWFWNLPNNNSVIGISFVESDVKRMIEAAKQDAAIQLTKSKSAIIISKDALIDNFDGNNASSRKLEYDIVGSKKLLRKNYKKLSLIDSCLLFNNYYIALFSTKPIKSLNNNIESHQQKIPNWFKKEGLVISKKEVFYYASATSKSLDIAYSKCFQSGRMEIAKYLHKEVKAMDKITNDFTERVYTAETIKRLKDISSIKNYVSYSKVNGKIKYTVYMKIGAF